ncbi:hypothetical protein [Pseudomonas sp. Q1]|uniref:hypothetical protein n=1 Tax=Pseudomonas sp. Q1 TaxID=2202823 RepID=UPI0013751733|nr:hypothetical protein [Pseudomonas sp. Q1]
MGTISFWFRRKYLLSPIDPRFLDLTLEQMEAEYWAYHYFEQPPGEEFDDDEFDEESILAEIEERALSKRQRHHTQTAHRAAELLPLDPGDWEDIDEVTA